MHQTLIDMQTRLQAIGNALQAGDHDTAAAELTTFDQDECRSAWAEIYMGNNNANIVDFSALCQGALEAAAKITPPANAILHDRFCKNERNIGKRKEWAEMLLSHGREATRIAIFEYASDLKDASPTYVGAG